jgi:hypothetical protein
MLGLHKLNSLGFEVSTDVSQLPLVLIILFNLFLKNLRDTLVGRREKVIGQQDVLLPREVCIVVYSRIQVE